MKNTLYICIKKAFKTIAILLYDILVCFSHASEGSGCYNTAFETFLQYMENGPISYHFFSEYNCKEYEVTKPTKSCIEIEHVTAVFSNKLIMYSP